MPHIDKVTVELEARTQSYLTKLKQAQAITRTTYTNITTYTNKMQKSVNENLAKITSPNIIPPALNLAPQELGAIAIMAPNLKNKKNSNIQEVENERKALEKLITTLTLENSFINEQEDIRKQALKTQRSSLELNAEEQATIASLTNQSMAYKATLFENAAALHDNGQAMQELKAVSLDTTNTFLNGIKNGKSATDSLNETIKSLMQNLLKSGLDTLFKGISGGGDLSGVINGLFSGGALGFAEGGYTGSGGKYEAAGLVHRGEVVWSQADIKRWGGAAAVNNMRRGLAMPSFKNGGVVGRAIGAPSLPSATSGSTSAGPQGGTQTVRVILQDDSGRMADIANQQIKTQSGAIVEIAVQRSVKNVSRNINAIASEGQNRYG